MFNFVYELMAGQHGELPRRRRADPVVEFDATAGGFVSDDGADHEREWLGRGELPPGVYGVRAAAALREAALARDGQSLADEMRQFVK